MDCKKMKRYLIHHRIKLASRNSLRSCRKSMSSKKTKARCSASSFWNAGLRANNRSLAQALQEMRIQFGLAHQQNLKYQHDIQILQQKINKLHQNNFSHTDEDRKLQKYKDAFIQIEGGLNNVGDKLIEAVDILSNLVQSSHEAIESINNEAPDNSYQTDKFEMTALQQGDKPRLLTDAVKASVLNMSVIMEQSGIQEEESSIEETAAEQKDPLSAKKQQNYLSPPILSPALEPSPLTIKKTFLETEEENLDSKVRASENFVLASKQSPAYQIGNQKLIAPTVKKIIDLSVTPPSPVLNIDFDAELKKFNSKYSATKVECSTPPSGKPSSSRREAYLPKESKPTLSYPISPGIKKTSNRRELFTRGISFLAQQKLLSITEVDGNSPQNTSSSNNSELPTNKRISESADEIEPDSKSNSYMDLADSVVGEKNGVDATGGFSKVQQNDDSKLLSSCSQTERNSCFLNNEVVSVECNALQNEGPGEAFHDQTCRERSYLCSIKEDSVLDPKKWESVNTKRPIRDGIKPKRVKKIKKQKHQKEINNETDSVPNASEKVINKENVDFEGTVRLKHIHVDFSIDEKTRNVEAEGKLYSSTPEGSERIRRALTPSNKKRKRMNKSSKTSTYILEKEKSLPVADGSFSNVDMDICYNIETERESSLFNYNRNSSVSSKEMLKPSLSNPSTPAVLENTSLDNSSVDGSERKGRRARVQVSSYKLPKLNAKLRRPEIW